MHQSNNNLCTHFHQDSKYCFSSAGSLFSQCGLFMGKNRRPLELLHNTEVSLSHTSLTGFEREMLLVRLFIQLQVLLHTRTLKIHSNKIL